MSGTRPTFSRPKRVRGSLAPDAVEQRVGAQVLADLQSRLHQAVGLNADVVHALAQPEGDAHRAHAVLQGLADLGVDELQQGCCALR